MASEGDDASIELLNEMLLGPRRCTAVGSRRNAQLVAAAAARTGSQWFDETALNRGSLELDARAAIAEVENLYPGADGGIVEVGDLHVVRSSKFSEHG